MAKFNLLNPASGPSALWQDVGILILRVSAGLMMAFGHGLGKVQQLLAGGEIQFADPIGIGLWPSLALAGGAEFFCALAVAVGFRTRLAALPVAFTMMVASLIVHVDDPFQKKELAFMYLVSFLAVFLLGPGRFSWDGAVGRK